jgi:hypothetical protein
MPDNEYKRNSAIKNESHDLRLINILKTAFEKYPNLQPIWIRQIPPPPIIFGQGMNEGSEEFGTEENETIGYPKQINNVTDAFRYLKDVVTKKTQLIANQTYYSSMTKLGELHIFDDGNPMEYKPFVKETPITGTEQV